MENLLHKNIYNLQEIAVLLYPDKTPAAAGSLLRMKVRQLNGNKLSTKEKYRIATIIKDNAKLIENELDS